MDIAAILLTVGIQFIAGWGAVLFLLWIRPEYGFLVFYVFAGFLLIFLLQDVWTLTWADVPDYAEWTGVSIAANLAGGALVVALFKWLKTRKTSADRRLDREMGQIRAEIAARDQSSQ